MPAPKNTLFAKHLLAWFDLHGRKNLPWQQNKNAYDVWVSEIMLQQTQVDTVIGYYTRFMARFPDVQALANADIDEVLHLWTGLGYYARARNLHKCARTVCNELNGEFPSSIEGLSALSGIGRSTAAAICSIAFGLPTAILDGNVKRVLGRQLAIAEWPGTKNIETQMWLEAQARMPKTRCDDYTQAIMDLGATLCTRSKPKCDTCPVQRSCKGLKTCSPTDFPGKKPKKEKPTKHCQMLVIYNAQSEISLYKRPSTGIWGGLWSLPELNLDEHVEDYVEAHFGTVTSTSPLSVIKHVFSHYTLMIHPVEVRLEKTLCKIMENQQQLWYNPHFPQELGLAAPVKKLLHG